MTAKEIPPGGVFEVPSIPNCVWLRLRIKGKCICVVVQAGAWKVGEEPPNGKIKRGTVTFPRGTVKSLKPDTPVVSMIDMQLWVTRTTSTIKKGATDEKDVSG